MGRVWRATDVVLHREVAIKELVPPPGLTPSERQEMRERSLREARAIARLNNINVVRVFDVLSTDADPWIVMEYVPSRSLQDVLAQDGPFNALRTAEIGLGVLNALRAAHRNGVVHRDVKPGNVLMGADGRVVLTDFGLATVPGDPNVTRTGLVLGSPAYIAPERARDGTAGPGADLWSLGATLYAAVEGQSPFARPSAIATLAALATENVPVARNAGPLKPVLNGLLRKDPAHRINAEEADRLLSRAAGRRSKITFPMSPTMRRPGAGRERPSLPSGPGGPPVLPGAGWATATGSAPVVPNPRPPVAQPPAADGRPPHFAQGKAQVSPDRRPAKPLDATRLDTPPVRDEIKPVSPGTGNAHGIHPGQPPRTAPGQVPPPSDRRATGRSTVSRPPGGPMGQPPAGPVGQPHAGQMGQEYGGQQYGGQQYSGQGQPSAGRPGDRPSTGTPMGRPPAGLSGQPSAGRPGDRPSAGRPSVPMPPSGKPVEVPQSLAAAPTNALRTGFTAADVAANRRKQAAPEHERSLAQATSGFPIVTPRSNSDAEQSVEDSAAPVETKNTPEISEPAAKAEPQVEAGVTSAPADGSTSVETLAEEATEASKSAEPETAAESASPAGIAAATVTGTTAGTTAAGVNAPGVNAPGVNAPGANAPGANAPGANAPGANAPGANAPGANAAEAGTAGSGTAGSGTAGTTAAESGTTGTGTTGTSTTGSGTAETTAAGSGTVGSGTAGSGAAGLGEAATGATKSSATGIDPAEASTRTTGTTGTTTATGTSGTTTATGTSGTTTATGTSGATATSSSTDASAAATDAAEVSAAGSVTAGTAAAGTSVPGISMPGISAAENSATEAGTTESGATASSAAESGTAQPANAQAKADNGPAKADNGLAKADQAAGQAKTAERPAEAPQAEQPKPAAPEPEAPKAEAPNPDPRPEIPQVTPAPQAEDRTTLLAPMPKAEEKTTFLSSPPEDRTTLLSPPAEEKTSLLARPPADEKTSLLARPPADQSRPPVDDDRTSVVNMPPRRRIVTSNPEPQHGGGVPGGFNRPSRPAWTPMELRPASRRGGVTIFGTTLTRRQAVIALAIVLTFVLLIGIIVAQAFGSDDTETPPVSQGGVGSVAPAQPSDGAASTGTSPTPSSAPPSSAPAATIPDGWRTASFSGLSFPVPDNARSSGGGSSTTYSWGKGRQFRIDIVSGKNDPVEYLEKDGSIGSILSGPSAVDFNGKKAADVEYNRNTSITQHVVRRVTTDGGRTIVLTWYTEAGDWDKAKSDLEAIYANLKYK
ncbi:hypothetical protein GCM10009828_010910 [Actinoplanes couchii]